MPGASSTGSLRDKPSAAVAQQGAAARVPPAGIPGPAAASSIGSMAGDSAAAQHCVHRPSSRAMSGRQGSDAAGSNVSMKSGNPAPYSCSSGLEGRCRATYSRAMAWKNSGPTRAWQTGKRAASAAIRLAYDVVAIDAETIGQLRAVGRTQPGRQRRAGSVSARAKPSNGCGQHARCHGRLQVALGQRGFGDTVRASRATCCPTRSALAMVL